DGGANTTLVGCANTTITPGEARHTILFYTNDSANNVNTSSNLTFTIDLTVPSLTIESPIDSAEYLTSFVDLYFTASDSGAGLDNCWYSLDGGANTTLTDCLNTSITLEVGVHNLTFYANDSANNVNASNNITFYMIVGAIRHSSEGENIKINVEYIQNWNEASQICVNEPMEIGIFVDKLEGKNAEVKINYLDIFSTIVFEGVTSPDGKISFTPEKTGTYKMLIFSKGVSKTEKFEVTECLENTIGIPEENHEQANEGDVIPSNLAETMTSENAVDVGDAKTVEEQPKKQLEKVEVTTQTEPKKQDTSDTCALPSLLIVSLCMTLMTRAIAQ
ncbi:MAG: hypothetical protein ABII22_03330, partial [Candidatus Micrarchaeota archaeon]